MGCFDRVCANLKCPICGEVERRCFQTKEFRCLQQSFKIGSSILWGDKFHLPDHMSVTGMILHDVTLYLSSEEPCKKCNHEFIAEVRVTNNIILEIDIVKSIQMERCKICSKPLHHNTGWHHKGVCNSCEEKAIDIALNKEVFNDKDNVDI